MTTLRHIFLTEFRESGFCKSLSFTFYRFVKYKLYIVVKWGSIIWLFGKKNNASKKIWEFVVPEIF